MKAPFPGLNGLRAFACVGKHLSMSKAATDLHVSAGAVSQRIKALENQLDIALFQRTGKGLSFTSVGRACLAEVNQGFELIQHLMDSLPGGKRQAQLPLNALCVVEAVGRSLNMSVTARELAVTTSAVSRHVQTIENTLSVKLFERLSKGLALTHEGDLFARVLTQAFEHFGNCVELASNGKEFLETPETNSSTSLLLGLDENALKAFVEHSPVSVAMFDNDMRYLAVNGKWRYTSPIGDQDARGWSHYSVYPNNPEKFRDGHRRGLAGLEQDYDEVAVQDTDGSTEWFRYSVQPWGVSLEKIQGIILYAENITDWVIAKQRAAQNFVQ